MFAHGACSLILIGYYAVTSTNYGGGSYSIRWFVLLLPLMFVFLYPVFKNTDGEQSLGVSSDLDENCSACFPFPPRLLTIVMKLSIVIACIGLIKRRFPQNLIR